MRRPTLLALVAFAVPVAAQPPDEKAATLRYVESHRDPATGAYRGTPSGKPSLRACNAAVKVVHYLGGSLADREKVAAFVLGCYDPATGGFAEPGSKPDVGTTAVGVMAAAELGLPADRFPKAVEYLHAHARTFEDVRIGAAALEALNQRPDWLPEWFKLADAQTNADGTAGKGDGTARDTGSVAAMRLRLGQEVPHRAKVVEALRAGQRPDGGFGKANEAGSDGESTYRVMRAFHLLTEKPADVPALRRFLAGCRNADGGSGVKPGEPSSLSGTYYAATVTKWLAE
jgi:hypothetical protein